MMQWKQERSWQSQTDSHVPSRKLSHKLAKKDATQQPLKCKNSGWTSLAEPITMLHSFKQNTHHRYFYSLYLWNLLSIRKRSGQPKFLECQWGGKKCFMFISSCLLHPQHSIWKQRVGDETLASQSHPDQINLGPHPRDVELLVISLWRRQKLNSKALFSLLWHHLPKVQP